MGVQVPLSAPFQRPLYSDHWVGYKGQGTYIDSDLNVDGKHVKAKGYTTDVLSDYAVEFLKRKHEKPFLLYLPHKAVHPELTQYADGSVNDPNGGTFLPPDRYKNTYASVTVKRAPLATQGPVGNPALLRDTRNAAAQPQYGHGRRDHP